MPKLPRPIGLTLFWLCFTLYTFFGSLFVLLCCIVYRLSARSITLPLWLVGKAFQGWGRLIPYTCKHWLDTDIQVIGDINTITPDRWWIITANHLAWTDIILLNITLRRYIDDLRFVLKASLQRIPIIGAIIQLLDYPAIDRGDGRRRGKVSPRELAQENQARIMRSCQLFQHRPMGLILFPEGTRFTRQKCEQQKSPYKHLLKPRHNGLTTVVDGMAPAEPGWLDVTLHYHGGTYSLGDFLCGRIRKITVAVQIRQAPGDSLSIGKPELNTAWQDKDQLIGQLGSDAGASV